MLLKTDLRHWIFVAVPGLMLGLSAAGSLRAGELCSTCGVTAGYGNCVACKCPHAYWFWKRWMRPHGRGETGPFCGTDCSCPPQGPFFGYFPTCWHRWPNGYEHCPVVNWEDRMAVRGPDGLITVPQDVRLRPEGVPGPEAVPEPAIPMPPSPAPKLSPMPKSKTSKPKPKPKPKSKSKSKSKDEEKEAHTATRSRQELASPVPNRRHLFGMLYPRSNQPRIASNSGPTSSGPSQSVSGLPPVAPSSLKTTPSGSQSIPGQAVGVSRLRRGGAPQQFYQSAAPRPRVSSPGEDILPLPAALPRANTAEQFVPRAPVPPNPFRNGNVRPASASGASDMSNPLR